MTIGNLHLPRTTRNYIIITMYTRSSGTARAAGADTKTRALVEHESNRVLQCASRIWSARSCVRCLVSFAALEPVYRRRLVTPASPEKKLFEKLPPPPRGLQIAFSTPRDIMRGSSTAAARACESV